MEDKKEHKRLVDYLGTSALLLSGVGVHRLYRSGAGRGFVTRLSESEYTRKFFRTRQEAAPDRLGILGAGNVREIYERAGVSMYSHMGYLFPADTEFIIHIAHMPGALPELEKDFVARVIKRMNRPFFVANYDKPDRLLAAFREMVDEGLKVNKVLRSILAEEVRHLERTKTQPLISRRPAPGRITIGEYISQKSNLFPHQAQMEAMETIPEERAIQRRLRQLIEGETADRRIPRGPVEAIEEVTRITEPEDRFVPLEELGNRTRLQASRGNLKQFFGELALTNADREAREFFQSLDTLLRAELKTINIAPSVTYQLRKGGQNLLEGIVEISFADPAKPPLRLKVPISSEHIITMGTAKWSLHPIQDLPSMLPGTKMAQGRNVYDVVLMNVKKRFRAMVWNTYGAGNHALAQRMLDENIVRAPFRATRQLYTAQPIATVLAQHQGIDIARRIAAGRFDEDLVPKRIVLDRVVSMQRLKTFITRAKGHPRIPSQYMVVDFETFPSTKNPHSVTISVVRNGEIVDMFNRDINPQSPEFTKGRPYVYPENDLRLSFAGMSRDQIKAKLEGVSGGLNSFDAVRREMMSFVRKHVAFGERLPLVAFGANFERDIIRRHFFELNSVLSEWIDPLDLQRALTPGVTSVSLSQQNIGIGMGLVELDPKSKSYRLSRTFLASIKRKPDLLHLLEKKGGVEARDFVRKLRVATTDEALEALALHTATTDVILTNEILVKTMKEIEEHAAEINVRISKALHEARRGFTGLTNPILSAHLAMKAAGSTYHAGSAATMLAGKTPGYNVKDLLPLLWPGIDPHRPLLQRFTGGELLKSAYPAIVTKKYKGIADTYGTLFQTMTVGLVQSPITAGEASLIDVQAADKMSVLGFSYTTTIPTGKQTRFHESIAKLIKELEAAPPERHASIISKRNKEIQRELARHSKISGWLPGETVIAQSSELKYRTKGKLLSQLEGIAFNMPGEEIQLTFRTVDRPGWRQQPIKFFAGVHKGVANIAKGLPFDAILHGNLAKRSRADAIMGHINRVAENLQLLYENTDIRQSPEFRTLVREFTGEVNRRGGIKLQPSYGPRLEFIDVFSNKDLSYVDKELITANLEEFARKDWASFMRRYATRIYLLRSKFGIQWNLTSPVLPYWTPGSIDQYLAREYRVTAGRKTAWAKLPKARKEAFRKSLERETLEFLRIDKVGEHISDIERRQLAKLRPGALRVIQKYGGEFLQIATLTASRAFEHGEVYAKGTMVKIPYLDSLVATGKIAEHVMRQRTPAQQALQEYYEMSYNTLMYGTPPPAGYPVKSGIDIKIPEVQHELAELEKITGRKGMVYVPEANQYYNQDRGVPVALQGANGELRAGLTKEVIPPGRWMSADTISSLYGTNPRFVEFEMGKYRSYIPIPGIQQISAATAPPVTLSTGSVYAIVQKETQTYMNLKRAADAYKIAEQLQDQVAMDRALQGYMRLERDYRQQILYNKSVFLERLNPRIAGIQGKVNALYLPGMEGIIGEQNKHLVAGFGVQKISLKDMSEDYFNRAMEAQRLPDGQYIGASGKRYRTKSAFRAALLQPGGVKSELLNMSLIRRPAESGTAWLETFVKITRDERTGAGMQHREALLTHYDPDGDQAAMIFNVMPPEEKEQHIRQIQLDRLRDRKLHRRLFERVRRFEQNILQHDALTEGAEKKALHKLIQGELAELKEMSGRMHIYVFNGGVSIRTPLEQTRHMSGRRLIRLGLGDEMKLVPMRNLQRFDPELGMDIVRALTTTAEEEYAGYTAQIMTKTATPFAFTPGHLARFALKTSGDPKSTELKDTLDKFYGKVTALKKFSGREAEEMVQAMIHPELPSSTRIMETLSAEFSPDLPPGEVTKIAGMARRLRMELGTRNASNLIRAAVRGTPLTPEMIQLYAEEAVPEVEISISRFFGFEREKVLGRLKKGNAPVAKAGSILGLGLAALFLTRKPDLGLEQEYVPQNLNLHRFQFPARTHIRRDDTHRARVIPRPLTPAGVGLTPASYARASDRAFDLR